MSMRPGGVLPVIPTPFLDGEIDYESFRRLLEFFLPHVDGYTLAGSTSESPSLSVQERKALLQFAMRNTPADKTVVLGITHTEVNTAIELARHGEALGVHGFLVPSPYYFPNTKRGVYDYLKLIDAHVQTDMIFYDNPYTTKTFWTAAELAEMAAGLEHLRGIKVTDHAIEKIAWLKAHTKLGVFCGDDAVLYRSLLLGADGCMVIAPAVCPRAFREAWQLLKDGQAQESYSLFSRKVLPFIHMFGIGSEIAATKALYKHLGLFSSDEVRPPLERCDDTWRDQLILSYETCNAL